MNRVSKRVAAALAAVVTVAVGATPTNALAGTPAATGSLAAAAPQAPPDPLATGPYAVTATEYNYGDTAFNPADFPGPIELRASVHYPTTLSGGPRPLVLLMHGRHSTCYKGASSTLSWPCPSGYATIPSFQGYDYLADNLASWGYIVVSVSANGINARDAGVADSGMTARAELMQKHLDIWNRFATTGAAPFDSLFVGKVNLQDVGEMGHSRGGEGVVRSYQVNAAAGSPYGIKAVFALAPVDFGRETISGVPLSVALPYCDGDVSDLQGVHFYDDSRYAVTGDRAPKYVQEVLSANHNYFNTVWTPGEFPAGTFDDSACRSDELTPEQQRNAGEAYMAAFFRMHLGAEKAFKPYFDGTQTDPASISPAQVHTSYLAPANSRLDVNRYLAASSLTTNDLGGGVTDKGLTPFDLCGGSDPEPAQCLSVSPTQQPHTTGRRPGLSQLRLGWDDGSGRLANRIPVTAQNFSQYESLTFRAARNFTDQRNTDSVPNFSVRLSDGSGGHATVKVADWSDALFQQPGSGSGLPKLVLNTVRIPLSAFAGVDLTTIRAITFRTDVKKTGAILTTDLAVTDRLGNP